MTSDTWQQFQRIQDSSKLQWNALVNETPEPAELLVTHDFSFLNRPIYRGRQKSSQQLIDNLIRSDLGSEVEDIMAETEQTASSGGTEGQQVANNTNDVHRVKNAFKVM